MNLKLKLGGRNLFYSMVLAGCMLTFLVGYFVYMLPSLYVDYMMEQNLRAVTEQHKVYMKSGSYANVQVKNPTACFSVKIPNEEDSIYLTAKFFSIKINMQEEQYKQMFSSFRNLLKSYDFKEDMGYDKDKTGEYEEVWRETLMQLFHDFFPEDASVPFQIVHLEQQDMESAYGSEYQKVHMMSNDLVVMEMGVEDNNNQYVNYIAIQRTEGSLVLTFLPVVTPDMNEIRPVVFQSIPMLGAVIFLLVLLFSQIYSKGIVSPMVRLVQHTGQMKNCRVPMDKCLQERKDEIGILAVTINELYQTIKAGYDELEEKNQALAEENKRQEVLLRASSHQLKTPISAALLLVDGMTNKIGRYQDTATYLPKVKGQLLSMKKMVEDILYLDHCGENLDIQKVEPWKVLENQLSIYRITIADKQLQVRVKGLESVVLDTDEILFARIVENILSNVINYTPQNGVVQILLKEQEMWIKNFESKIDVDILPHIFEPFVSGNHDDQENRINSHGLGLYIAAYYAKKIRMKIDIYNEENGVVTVIHYLYTPSS